MNANVLNNETLIVEVRIKPIEEDHWQNRIPKNPFLKNMLDLFLDEETSDMALKVESKPRMDAPYDSTSKVFSVHKLIVLKTCTKGSILASLCEDCDGNAPVQYP